MDELIAKVVKKHYPEIALGLHVPIWAEVTAIPEGTPRGAVSTEFRPYRAVNLRLLTKGGKVANLPELEHIPLAIETTYPMPGDVVELTFAFGLMSKPYVSNVLPYNKLQPELKPGETTQSPRADVYQTIDDVGNVITSTDREIKQVSAKHTLQTGDKAETTRSISRSVARHDTTSVGGTHKIESIGGIRHTTAGQMVLGALESIEVATASDLNENVAGSRQTKVLEKLQMIVQDKGSLEISDDGIELIAESGTVHVGTADINLVQVLIDTLDLVSQSLLTLSTHTHVVPSAGTSAPAMNSGETGGQAAAAEAMIAELTPILPASASAQDTAESESNQVTTSHS